IQAAYLEKSAEESSGKAPRALRVKGKYYLEIRRMGALDRYLREAGQEIVKHCASAGQPATLEKRDGQYVVLSLVPFDSPDSPQALAYARRIHSLGREFVKQTGSKYDFDQYDAHNRLKGRFVRAE
ncbi:MAG: hypothetical protein J7M14_01185, partial [Planctomycetes bacterium]|nr:hypothetical protein [Planctomycetota bacterium]